MALLDLLDRPIAFHRPLVDITGSITAALMLSQALYWTKRTKEADGWFYKTQEEWKEETGMSRTEQETARKALLKCGVWEERYERLAHRMFFRVDTEKLSRMLETYIRESEIPAVGTAGNPQSSNGTETTAKSTGEVTLSLSLETEAPRKLSQDQLILRHLPQQYHDDEVFTEALDGFIRECRKKHPVTERAGKMIAKDLAQWGRGNATLALETSIRNGWRDVFAPKTQQRPNPSGIAPSTSRKPVEKTWTSRKPQA